MAEKKCCGGKKSCKGKTAREKVVRVVEEYVPKSVKAAIENPGAVPVGVVLTTPLTESSYCKELIILAELNPVPLACRFAFSPMSGTTEIAVRLRLTQTQTLHALARMSDGRVLGARQAVTVAASGCGM